MRGGLYTGDILKKLDALCCLDLLFINWTKLSTYFYSFLSPLLLSPLSYLSILFSKVLSSSCFNSDCLRSWTLGLLTQSLSPPSGTSHSVRKIYAQQIQILIITKCDKIRARTKPIRTRSEYTGKQFRWRVKESLLWEVTFVSLSRLLPLLLSTWLPFLPWNLWC